MLKDQMLWEKKRWKWSIQTMFKTLINQFKMLISDIKICPKKLLNDQEEKSIKKMNK